MRLPLLLAAALTFTACQTDRPRTAGMPKTFVPGRDGGAIDAGAGLDGGTTGDDAAVSRDAGAGHDGGSRDAGIIDAGTRDAGARDAGFYDAGPRDGGPPAAEINLSFSGCSPDFGGDIVVSYNGSIGIASVRNSVLTASLQFDLDGTGTKVLSTRHRIDSGEVVNLVIGTTWTNMSTDADVITGNAPDPIGGTLVVREYTPSNGRIDATFNAVTLAHVQNGSVCRIDGDIRATRIGR